MHIACALGIPTLGLFGPSQETLYGPLGDHAKAIRGTMSYEDLINTPDYDHRNATNLMSSLTVDTVEAATLELLSKISKV